MSALSIMRTTAILLVRAAIGGLAMAVLTFRGADRPRSYMAALHGLLVAVSLTLLVYAAAKAGLSSPAPVGLVILVVVELAGASFNPM